MKKQLTVHPFPHDAESNGFIAALSSAVCAAKIHRRYPILVYDQRLLLQKMRRLQRAIAWQDTVKRLSLPAHCVGIGIWL